jgi:hypothetical protein
VESTGWVSFFLLCTMLAVPGMVLLVWVAPWRGASQDGNSAGDTEQSSAELTSKNGAPE